MNDFKGQDVTWMLCPGVYCLYLGDSIQWIGQATVLAERIAHHWRGHSTTVDGALTGIEFDRVKARPCEKEGLDIVEARLIRDLKPKHNDVDWNRSRPEPNSITWKNGTDLDEYVDEIIELFQPMGKANTMSLYNAKSTKDREVLRISKFDDCLQHEGSYLVGPKTCDCPAFFKRNQCKHQQMRVMFRAKHAIDSDQFLDFEKREWRALEEIAVADGQMIIAQLTGAVEKVPFGQSADEVGEPVISGLSTAPPAPEVAAVASGAPPSEAKSFLRRRL